MMVSEEEIGYVITPAKRMKMMARMDVMHKTLTRMEAEDKAWREETQAETEATEQEPMLCERSE
jgi:hypothetical protein